jgi:predicted ATPase/class 3 adenylate cyclase
VSELPSGTVTFLFTDLKGSTRLWEQHPQAMKPALARHDAILNQAVESTGGRVVKATGDGIHAAFPTAQAALEAALSAQLALADEPWGQVGPLQVRMGLHTGIAELRDGDYFGPTLNRAARIMSVANPGQVLCSQATADLVRDTLPADVSLIELGRHALRDLQRPELVSQLTHPDLPREFPPLLTVDAYPGNLPRQVTTFVGRQQEVETISHLVTERPLVTLTGVGGVGKTRLAVQVAAEVVPEFSDGAWLCELAPVTDPEAVWETLAAIFGVRPSAGLSFEETVLEYLQIKRLLLVLDNCEHLLGRIADMVSAIAQRCPRVSVLATSREGLAIAGEQIVAVPSLGLPPTDIDDEPLIRSESVRLFCDRAHDAKNDFALTDHNAGAIGQLCRRLDGIPLAIELAAARVRSLPPEDLVERLDQRFRLLTRGSRAAIERHQTLRNTIDWSYDLLSDAERGALNRLAVFTGGFDLSACEAILARGDLEAADAAGLLSQLVDKSLVLVESNRTTRYRLLETIRQYAQERLEASGETANVRTMHLKHYLAVAEAAGPHLRNRDQIAWSTALARETDNFRAGLDWAVEASMADQALRLVAPLMVTGIPTGWTATDWAEVAVTVDGSTTHQLFPLVMAFAGMGATMRGDLARAATLVTKAEEAQDALGTRHLWVYAAAGTLAFFQGNLEQTRRHAGTWVELARASGDQYEISHALILLATGLLPDPARAIVFAEEAVRTARDAGIASALLYALQILANLFPPQESVRSYALLEEAVEVGSMLGDRQAVASATQMKAAVALGLGDWRQALKDSSNSAQQYLEIGQSISAVAPAFTASVAFANMRRFESAAVLLGFVEERVRIDEAHAQLLEQLNSVQTATVESLGEQQASVLRARGAALEFTDALSYLCNESERAL